MAVGKCFLLYLSVAEANTHSLGKGYELTTGINVFGVLSNNVLKGNVGDLIALQSDHTSEFTSHSKFNCRIAVSCGENSVVRCGSAASLYVTESGCSCLGAYESLELVCHLVGVVENSVAWLTLNLENPRILLTNCKQLTFLEFFEKS